MDIRDEIKSIIIQSGWTISDLVMELHEQHGWSNSVSNFSNKLSKETLRYKEALEIAQVLGLKINWLSENLIIVGNNHIDHIQPTRGTQKATRPNKRLFDPNALNSNKPSDE